MEKIYVCSQYGTRGNKETNLELAKAFCMAVIEEGNIPICPHLFYSQVLNDDVESQREDGLRIGLELLKDCSELRIFTGISEGMREEIKLAVRLGIPVAIGGMVHKQEDEILGDLSEIWGEVMEEQGNGKEHHSEEN